MEEEIKTEEGAAEGVDEGEEVKGAPGGREGEAVGCWRERGDLLGESDKVGMGGVEGGVEGSEGCWVGKGCFFDQRSVLRLDWERQEART